MKAIELAQRIISDTNNYNKEIEIKYDFVNPHTFQHEDLDLYLDKACSDGDKYVLKLEDSIF